MPLAAGLPQDYHGIRPFRRITPRLPRNYLNAITISPQGRYDIFADILTICAEFGQAEVLPQVYQMIHTRLPKGARKITAIFLPNMEQFPKDAYGKYSDTRKKPLSTEEKSR